MYLGLYTANELASWAEGRAHLGGEQGVRVELLQPRHQLVPGGDDVLHEAAGEREPIRAARHLQALWDAALAEAPHVVVALVEEAVQALLLDEPWRDDTERAGLKKKKGGVEDAGSSQTEAHGSVSRNYVKFHVFTGRFSRFYEIIFMFFHDDMIFTFLCGNFHVIS